MILMKHKILQLSVANANSVIRVIWHYNLKVSLAFVAVFFMVFFLSGCGSAFVISKEGGLLEQIDVWSANNEYGKAFASLKYVSSSHPQYQQLQARKKNLLTQASAYEQNIDKRIQQFVTVDQWSQALDLLDHAKEKYPLDNNTNRGLNKTEKKLIEQQYKRLLLLDQKTILERSQWLINTRQFYQEKLKIDPRNRALKLQLKNLNKESKVLSKKLALLSQQAINKRHYITARTRVNQAIALDPGKSRQRILSQFPIREKKSISSEKKSLSKEQEQIMEAPVSVQTLEIQQNAFLEDIEKSYNDGDFAKTRRLIANLDENEQNTVQLIRLKQKLELSINYTIERLILKANKHYTDGQFHQAIELWLQILIYDPQNSLAKKNILRSEKVIDKLSDLREKQQN